MDDYAIDLNKLSAAIIQTAGQMTAIKVKHLKRKFRVIWALSVAVALSIGHYMDRISAFLAFLS